MKTKIKLKLAWCDHAAVRYACERWHYSRSVPAGKKVSIGVWESDTFIGCIVFSRGGIYNIGKPFGLLQKDVCELTRVALTKHVTPVSRILRIALSMLKRHCPGVALVVSFADPEQGHHGGIYAASGWVYLGPINVRSFMHIKGVTRHPRSVYSQYGTSSISWLRIHVDPMTMEVLKPGKHKYVMPLNSDVAILVNRMSKPYPKRAESADGGTSSYQLEGGGSIPTSALKTKNPPA